MKKPLYCCLSIALVLSLLMLPLATAAAEPVETPEEKGSTAYGDPYFDDFPSELHLWYGIPPLDEWGVDDIDYYVYMLAEAYVSYHYYYLGETEMPYMPLWAAIDPTVESPEEFLEVYGIDMGEYFELEEFWEYQLEASMNLALMIDENIKQRRIEALEALGGTPGIVNVMVDGEFLVFTDDVPQIKDDVAFVPAKPFLEAIGAAFEFNTSDSAMTARFKDRSISLKPGEDKLRLFGNGTDEVFPISEPYVDGAGTLFIPVRGVAEALGLEVYWDSYFEAVVVIDAAALIAEIDSNFNTFNKLLAMLKNSFANGAGVYKTAVSLPVSIKFFDSLDGDKSLAIDASAEILADGSNYNMTAGTNYDVDEMLELILAVYPLRPGEMDEIIDSEEMAILELISEAESDLIEMIVNGEKNILYMRSPILNLLIPELPEGAWLAAGNASRVLSDVLYSTMDRDTIEAINMMNHEEPSIGLLCYSMNSFNQYYNQVFLYEGIKGSAEELGVVFGDGGVRQKGNDYTLSVTSDDYADQAYEDDPYFSGYSYYDTRFELDVTLNTDGKTLTGMSGRYLMRERYYYSNSTNQIKLEFEMTPEKVGISVEIHEKNSYVMRIDMEMTTAETGEKVLTEPPEGDEVYPIEDFIREGYEEYGLGAINPLSGNA